MAPLTDLVFVIVTVILYSLFQSAGLSPGARPGFAIAFTWLPEIVILESKNVVYNSPNLNS